MSNQLLLKKSKIYKSVLDPNPFSSVLFWFLELPYFALFIFMINVLLWPKKVIKKI